MQTKKIVVALKGIILLEGKILIVKRAPNDQVGANTWEFAGGKLEFGEGLEVALKREILEEVGLQVTAEKILYASTFQTDPFRQVVIIVYLCHALDKEVVLSKEHSEYLWVSKEELKEYLPQEIILDLIKNQVFDQKELS